MIGRRKFSQSFVVFGLYFLMIWILLYILARDKYLKKLGTVKSHHHQKIVTADLSRKDWHDVEFIKYEKSRKGPGEQGKAFKLTNPKDIAENKELFKSEDLSGIVSDNISVNRSIPDFRLPQCSNLLYLKKLPKVSVIIAFHNDYPSVLKRTIHSVFNRSPPELIHEIILVNDASTKKVLHKTLKKYMQQQFRGKVKIFELPKRSGLISARLEGTKHATGEVLVFLDAQIEVGTNWLPPLLEPIALHRKTATAPHVDFLSSRTFKHTICNPNSRGIFDWNFIFCWLPRRPQDQPHPWKPAPLPMMLGCAFAIRRDYFYELGTWDEGLKVWNGEHYELSLKIWLCGGQLLEVPCSRVSHTFHSNDRTDLGFDYVAYNFKRIAEVWLDDYKHKIYEKDPSIYEKINPGDLTNARALKKELNCKPFKYYIENVVPDMLERYPLVDQGVFASGTIQSKVHKNYCMTYKEPATIRLKKCQKNLRKPGHSQDFALTWYRNIKVRQYNDMCLLQDFVHVEGCMFEFEDEYWFYKMETQQIINPPTWNCLTASADVKKSLFMSPCDRKDENQKWLWGFANVTALKNWKTFGVKLPK